MDRTDETKTGTGARAPSAPEALYALGIIGAWVWFWRAAEGFGEHAWAIVQGVFWPAYLVYEALQALRG